MKSAVIYKGTHYTVCHMRDGSLIVTSNRTGKGVRLTGESVIEWVEAITTAIDDSECHALCRTIIIN